MTLDERGLIAHSARLLGELLERGAIGAAEFNAEMQRLTDIAVLLTVLPRAEVHEAEVIPFPGGRR